MSAWTVAAVLVFGAILVATVAVQPGRWRWRSLVRARDPVGLIPWWTFFAPYPGTTDTRLLWRERLVDGAVGPWREAVPPPTGLRRAVWNPTKRARKAVWDCSLKIPPAWGRGDDAMAMLRLPYLMIVQHVVGQPASPRSASRQFALVATQGADHEDGLFELRFVSPWHRLTEPAD